MRTNEINIRDPYILLHEDRYYLYGTRSETCWGEADGDVFFTDGPCVMKLPEGELVMTWSSWSERAYAVGVAVSDSGSIRGPWRQLERPLYPQNGGHGMLFADMDGKLWFTLHSPNDKYLERPVFYPMGTEGGLHLESQEE